VVVVIVLVAFVSDRSGNPEIWLDDAAGQNAERLTHFDGPLVAARMVSGWTLARVRFARLGAIEHLPGERRWEDYEAGNRSQHRPHDALMEPGR
jgi:hypothetical protein